MPGINLRKAVVLCLSMVGGFMGIYGQNLVPNPSLEDYDNCPMGPSELAQATPWATPDSATPDYYNACYTSLFPLMPSMDVPDNIQGYQHAHTGDGYGGIICYDGSMGGIAGDYREYMRVQLTSPLTAGTEYKMRFWWSLADKSPFTVEQIGVLVTDEYINYFGGGQDYTSELPYDPTIATSGSQLDDTSNWVLVEECFIAEGGEDYIYIGNFNGINDVNFVATDVSCDMQTGGCFAYYYIDDVSLEDGSCDPIVCNLHVTVEGTDATCGDSNGTATVTPSDGTEPYFYQWDTGDDTESISDLPAGIYNVTVTDHQGCTAEGSVTIADAAGPDINTDGISVSDATCNADDGSVTGITVTGGTEPIDYTWEDGSGTEVGTSLDLTNMASGSYTLIVTDANGCTASVGPYMISDIGGPTVDASNVNTSDATCGQSSGAISGITVSGGAPPYYYSWLNADQEQVGMSPDLNNAPPGEYILVVTDENNCSSQVGPFTINNVPGPSLSYTSTDVSCYGDSDGSIDVTVTGGAEPYHFSWSSGVSTEDLTDIPAGDYGLTVTDDNGCTGTAAWTILEPEDLAFNYGQSAEICEGQTVTLTVSAYGGTPPYTYHWSDSPSLNVAERDVSPDQTTTYSVYVSDDNGCTTDPQEVTITVSPSMALDLTITDVMCNGDCTGIAELTVTGGMEPLDFSWDSETNILNQLCTGFYTLTVTDDMGCATDTSFYIEEPPELTYNTITEPASCNGSPDGLAAIYVQGGTPPYQYLWSNNFTSDSIENVYPGTYYITVEDANDCRIETSLVIGEPEALEATKPSDTWICQGESYTMSTQVIGGTPNYSFHWSGTDGSDWYTTPFTVSPVETENYGLTVTDGHGCTTSVGPVTVNVYPDLRFIELYSNQDSVCPGEPITIYADVTGGNGGPYELTTNEGEVVPSPFTVYPEESDTLILALTDGCTTPAVYDSITWHVWDTPPNNFVADHTHDCPPSVFNFTELNEGEGNEYLWDFGDNGYAHSQNPAHTYQVSGDFDVTLRITNEHGCITTGTIEDMITIWPKPDAEFYTDNSELNVLNGQVQFFNTSTGADSLYWTFGDGDSTVNSRLNPIHYYNQVGEYEVILYATNIYGCKDTTMKIVHVRDQFSFYAPTAFSPNEDGINDCFRVCGHGIDPNTFTMSIYDRWGQPVFETEVYYNEYLDIRNCGGCVPGSWDGTGYQGNNQAGDPRLPSGVYIWYCEFKDWLGNHHEYDGRIQLVR